MRIGIIGAGASGMAAAIAAAQNPEHHIFLLERQARVGRKLQATGNGRCNLTNLHAQRGGYHGDDPAFSQYAIAQYPPETVLNWFRSLGLYTVSEVSGRVYPYSDQANSVVDVLRFALKRENITFKPGFEVEKLKRQDNEFRIVGREETITVDKVIVACGGLAGSKLGGSMAGYQLLRSMGHHCTKLRPALVQIKTDWPGVAGLKGVRAECSAEITRNGVRFACSRGELQFTELGLSGPVMFEISRDVCREPGQWQCVLDFLPELSEEELTAFLMERRSIDQPCAELFTGILHNRLGMVLVKECGIPRQKPMSELTRAEAEAAAGTAKQFCVHLTEPLGMDSAQVTAGGIVTDEFDRETMESKLVPGLYACGEVLDVDGDCGGYNLQWAWSSGILAGTMAGR